MLSEEAEAPPLPCQPFAPDSNDSVLVSMVATGRAVVVVVVVVVSLNRLLTCYYSAAHIALRELIDSRSIELLDRQCVSCGNAVASVEYVSIVESLCCEVVLVLVCNVLKDSNRICN